MLGWIKVKIGTGTTSGEGVTEPVARGEGQRDGQSGQRDAPSTLRAGQRRGSFLDGGWAMGRGNRKKDDRSYATSQAEQLDAQRAEKISCVAFKLVREIQRILKEARETQAAGGSGSSLATGSTPATSRTPAATPPPPRQQRSHAEEEVSSEGSSIATERTVTATSATSSINTKGEPSGAKRNRWAGTEELLSLLNGGNLGNPEEDEERVESYESVADVQAKMQDLVEQALVPESHGDLCGILLEASTGEGRHPAFVKLCVDAGVPSNLVHCLRIMRVIEFESAMHDDSDLKIEVVRGEEVDAEEEASGQVAEEAGTSTATSSMSAIIPERPRTERATERIGQLLVTLCRDKSAGVGEQIKPHLPGLLSLAVSAYPPNGAHVQETARLVVEALMGGCLNASMVWLLLYQKAMREVVGELRHLCCLDEAPSRSPTPSSRKGIRTYNARVLSPLAKAQGEGRKRLAGGASNSGSGVGGGVGEAGVGRYESPWTELVGEDAEEKGLWLTAVRATVCTVRCASRFVPAFVQDFESAGGYETMAYMVRRSSIERLPAMLEQVCLLVSALSSAGVEPTVSGDGPLGGRGGERSEFAASNPGAFSIIQSLLAECTPPVEAVCLQGIVGRVSAGTCEVNCLAGGVQVLVENGLDPEEAVVMVAERAVAMRLDRWGREHGTPEMADESMTAVPARLSSSSSFEAGEDDGGSDHETRSRSGTGELNGRRVPPGAGDTAADVAEADEFRLRLLEAVLGLYSNHPMNYGELEARYHALSLFLCALPYYESIELKSLALKTLEVICVSFKDVHPRDALHSTSTAFTVCLGHMMGLLSVPLSSPAGTGHRAVLMSGSSGTASIEGSEGGVVGGAAGDCDADVVGVDRKTEVEDEEETKVSASLAKALVLLEDADMMRRMLEKLLEFDEKKYTAMFQATGILDQVLQPLLKRALSLNVGGCPGATRIWRAMRHPGTITGQGAIVGVYPLGQGNCEGVEETGALALVSRATCLLCGTLALLLGYSPAICRQFRALRMHDTLYDVIRDFGPPSTDAALLALEKASASEPSGVPDDMAFLIELVQGGKSRAERWRQAAALMGLRSILLCRHQAVKDVWRESCGFEAALAAISSLDAAFSPSRVEPMDKDGGDTRRLGDGEREVGAPMLGVVSGEGVAISSGTGDKWISMSPEEVCLMEAEHFRVIQAALFTLVASASAGSAGVVRGEQLVGSKANRRYLRREIGYDSLTCCLVNSGVVASPRYAGPAVKLLFTMVTELPCETMRFECEPKNTAGGVGKSNDGVARLGGGGKGLGSQGNKRKTSLGGFVPVGEEEAATVRNADAVMVILGVLPYVSEEIAWSALGALNEVVRAGGYAEAEALVRAGAIRKAADVLTNALHAERAGTGARDPLALTMIGANGGTIAARGGGVIIGGAPHTPRALLRSPGGSRDRVEELPAAGGKGGSVVSPRGGERVAGSPRSSAADTLRGRVSELHSRGTVALLSKHLRLTPRLEQRLVEFMVLVASRHLTTADLAPLIRSVTLPLVVDSRGYVAPPTVWPAGMALPPGDLPPGVSWENPMASAGKGLWLPGWGTFFSGMGKPIGSVRPIDGSSGREVAERKSMGDFDDEAWRWLTVLSGMSMSATHVGGADSTPFLRLGGSPHTDMSGVCHEVARAPHSGNVNGNGSSLGSGGNGGNGSNLSSSGSGGAGTGVKVPLWRAQQKALVEAALEEGLRFVHVPGLEGGAAVGAGAGVGGAGGGGVGGGVGSNAGNGSGGSGAAWPGPAGYSFTCWMRFNPPESLTPASVTFRSIMESSASSASGRGSVGDHEGLPELMQSWGLDAGRAAAQVAGSTAVSPEAQGPDGGGIVSGTAGILVADQDEGVGLAGAELEESGDTEKSPVLRSMASPDGGSGSAMAGLEKTGLSDGGGSVGVVSGGSGGVGGASPAPGRPLGERKSSVDSAGERNAEEDETVPRPHLPGRQVLWVFAVASLDGKSFLQLFFDLDLLRFCLRGSAFRGEIRFKTPRHLACGGPGVWHHVMLTHARPKSRILGTRDKLCLWVDGELADTVKVDAMNFTNTEGATSAYLGCPHPQAFLDTSVGGTVAPLWHLGPCALISEVVDLAPLMFTAGPEYTGFWTAESPLDAVSSANSMRALRHLQALGGEAGFAAVGGDVPHALHRRRLRELDRYFNVTERAFYLHRSDRFSVTDAFHLLLAPEQITFAYHTRHMERPGGPPAPAAAGAGLPLSLSDTSAKARGGAANTNPGPAHDDLYYDALDGSRRPSQVPLSAKRAAISASLVTGWLFNVARETSPPSAGPGPVACSYGTGIAVSPSSFPRALAGAGGPAMLFPLLQRAQTEAAICATLRVIGLVVKGGGASSAAYMQTGGGYLVMAGLLRCRRNILGPETARVCFEMAVDRAYSGGVAARRAREMDARLAAEGGVGNLGVGMEKDWNRPWNGEDNGRLGGGRRTGCEGVELEQQKESGMAKRSSERREEAEEAKNMVAWGWEKGLAFMPRETVKQVYGGAIWGGELERQRAGGADGDGTPPGQEQNGENPSQFVLLTDPYALKNLVMNHQRSADVVVNPKHGRTRSLRRASCLEWGRFLTLTRNSDCAVHANEENVQHALGIRALCSDQTRTGCVVDGFSQVVLCFHGLNSCCCERLLNAWQIWGLDDRELMATILQLMHSLVSPHNSKAYCRFNARVLHRIGLFRWGLHFLLEASEPLPAFVEGSSKKTTPATTPNASSGAANAGGKRGGQWRKSGSKRVVMPIAGFGGVHRPAAVVAAAGLDTRDGFMVSCTLLLQRILATCSIQRDFDRVVGATLSTLADGGAGAREARGPGRDQTFAGAESVLRQVDLLGEEGSSGDKILSGQAMVRLYLLRMLLEIVTLPVSLARNSEFPAAEGCYVGGVGSPCARQAQAQADARVCSGIVDSGKRGTQLERWVRGVPPVVDVSEVEGKGLTSPLYIGKQRILTVCARALRPDWFISLLETCREEAGVAWTFRLLAAMLQGSDEFALGFQEADGYRAMGTSLPRHSASLPVLLSALALALRVPIAALPATGEGMGAENILNILRRNAGMATGPSGLFPGASGHMGGGASGGLGGVRAVDEPRPFMRVCVAKVLLPALRFNAALVRRAEAAGIGSGTVGRSRVRGRSGRQGDTQSLSPAGADGKGGVKGIRSPVYRGARASTGGVGVSSSGASVEASEVSDWRRAKTVNEIVSAALREGLVSDPSFRLTCRSADVVGALVDVLGGIWDEPEPGVGGGGRMSLAGKVESDRRGEDEEIEVEGVRGARDGLSPLSSTSPPPKRAELLRLVVADIVANGGPVVFPALVRLFNSGAEVMGPTLPRKDPASAASGSVEPDMQPSSPPPPYARDLSPLGTEPGASAGGFQRSMLRHLEACCRDAVMLSAAGMSSGVGERLQLPLSQQRRSTAASHGPNAFERTVGSLAAVASAVAEAAADGLLPGVETGHLAVGFLLSVLRQVATASMSMLDGKQSPGAGDVMKIARAGDGAKSATLGACHIATVVALRRAIRRENGKASRGGHRRGTNSTGGSGSATSATTGASLPGSGVQEPQDLLEECLLMIAHNLDTLLGEERRRSASMGASSVSGLTVSSPYLSPPPPSSSSRLSSSPKPRSPISFRSAAAAVSFASGGGAASASRTESGPETRRQLLPPPLDLGGISEASTEPPLTITGMFADTPVGMPRWSSRFDFPGESDHGAAASDPNRMNMTFSAVELSNMNSSASNSVHGTSGSTHSRMAGNSSGLLMTPSSARSPTTSTGKSLWESAAAGAAGLVAAADRGARGGVVPGGGGDVSGSMADGGVHGLRESLVHRLRGSTDRAFIAGFVAELRGLLLSDSDRVRRLATRLAEALLARRRAAVQELLGEELPSMGLSMLEHPFGADASLDPTTDDEALAEERIAQVVLNEGFDRAKDRAYALIPHMTSEDGLSAALTRAELSASGGGGGGGAGGDGSSTLSRLGSGVGGALGALAAAGPNRKTITVDRAIQRADMIARTFERVATSHGRWVWAGADDLSWASRAWQLKLDSLRGKASLWEGGLFGRLMRGPEAIPAARASEVGLAGGLEEERFKLDIDEGPERARLKLRPNYAFYDTYDVLAPRPSAPVLLTNDRKSPEPATSDATAAASAAVVALKGASSDEVTTLRAKSPDGVMMKPSGGMAMAMVRRPPRIDTGSTRRDRRPGDNEQVVVTPGAVSFQGGSHDDGSSSASTPAGMSAVAVPGNALASAGPSAKSTAQSLPPEGGDVAVAGTGVGEGDGPVGVAPPTSSTPNAEGGVAAITALVKTMSETVGVTRSSKMTEKPLKGVFDLDDTDTSALLELEELNLTNVREESDTRSTADGIDGESQHQRSPTAPERLLPPSIPSGVKAPKPSSSASRARGSTSSKDDGTELDEVDNARRSVDDGGSSAERKMVTRNRSREPGRGFTLTPTDLAEEEEDEDIDDDDVSTVTESTHLGLDDDDEEMGVELAMDGGDEPGDHDESPRGGAPEEDEQADDAAADSGSPSAARSARGRQRGAAAGGVDSAMPRHGEGEKRSEPQPAGVDGSGSAAAVSTDSVDVDDDRGGEDEVEEEDGGGEEEEEEEEREEEEEEEEGAEGEEETGVDMSSGPEAGGASGIATSFATVPAPPHTRGQKAVNAGGTSSGPGAAARAEGWSDRELLLGLMQPEDKPVVMAHDVRRSIGGVEVKRGLLLVCNNVLYCVDGFGRGPRTPRPGTGGAPGGQSGNPGAKASGLSMSAGAGVGAGSVSVGGGSGPGGGTGGAGNRKKDPLLGVRCLEEWELGGGAGSVGGSDDLHGDPGGAAKIQVTLRKKSSPDMMAGSGSSGSSSARREAGKGQGALSLTSEGAGGAGRGEVDEMDEIVELGHIGVERIVLDRVHAVYKRRYQLRDVGLEIFDVLGHNVLVSLETQDEQEEVLMFLLTRGLPASIFARAKSKLRLALGSSRAQARAAYKKFMQAERSSWTKKWQLGRCTNFEYLMALNTLAGRSFNDLTQYPVFPWVLRDYVSEELDLDNPAVFRDLSKPMGAIGEARARQFRERYAAVIEAAEETGRDPDPPPFHYGTHYSCAGYILHYLLRLEPFTRLALGLQGGRFDKADRLFRDVRSSWESASSENLQDVRELTPEFFTVPEFLVNSNRFDLGVTQKGQAVNHVVLPPWAKGDPREFIRLHRKALESPYVSQNLHEWIGLIFGCKQRGPEAVEAQNVFVHLTYEGEVDIDSIQDPLLRDAALAQIHNFGQTPSLVLKKPHPPREIPPVVRVSPDASRSADPAAVEWHAALTPPLCIVGAPDAVALKAVALTSLNNAWHASTAGGVGDACIVRDKVVGVGMGSILYPRSPDKYIRYGGPSCGLSFFQSPAGGAATSSKSSGDRLLSSHASLHATPVTALACTEDGQLLLTGAADGTCRLWGVVNLQHGGGQVVKTLDLIAMLGCHAGLVTCAAVSMGSGSGVTGGSGGKVLVWDIRRKVFVRELPGHRSAIISVGINHTNGNVISLAGSELRVWTVNGRLLATCSVTAHRRAMPTCAASTDCPDWQDGVVAATGHDNGDVSLWSIAWDTTTSPSTPRAGTHRTPMAAGRSDAMTPGSTRGRRGDRSSPSNRGRSSGGRGGSGSGRVGAGTRVRQLRLRRVLSRAHQRPITLVRVCEGGRELLVGDSRGEMSRWQCIRLDQLSAEELNQLM